MARGMFALKRGGKRRQVVVQRRGCRRRNERRTGERRRWRPSVRVLSSQRIGREGAARDQWVPSWRPKWRRWMAGGDDPKSSPSANSCGSDLSHWHRFANSIRNWWRRECLLFATPTQAKIVRISFCPPQHLHYEEDIRDTWVAVNAPVNTASGWGGIGDR